MHAAYTRLSNGWHRLLRVVACGGAAGVAALLGPPAQAQVSTVSKTVSLSATLTAQCRLTSASAAASITLTFPTYTAFSASAVTAPSQTINFECTRGLTATPTFTWDTGSGTAAGEGVIAGLRYALNATNGSRSNGQAPALGNANDIGTPDTYPVTVSGTMPAGQAGAGPSGNYTAARTLTVSF